MTHLYGPAVCCKSEVSDGGDWSCASVSGPWTERLCSWPLWIPARIRSHSLQGPGRPDGSADHGCDGETVSPSPQSNSQTSVVPLSATGRPKLLISRRCCDDACFVIAPLRQYGPSDASQLVGERSCQNIAVQPFCRGRKPWSKAMLCPVSRSEQDHAGALHEQRA